MSTGEAQKLRTDAIRVIGAIDDLPVEVRQAIKGCDFLIDIQGMPRGFNWRDCDLVGKIAAIKTFKQAEELDRWLLNCRLWRPR